MNIIGFLYFAIIIIIIIIIINRSEVTVYILEQSSLGSLGRVLANNTYIHLQNPTRKVRV